MVNNTQAESTFHTRGLPRRRRWRWLFAASGGVPLLGLLSPTPDPTLLIYTLFVFVAFVRPVPHVLATRCWAARFAVAPVGCGLLTECLAWTNNFLKCAPSPALLHPQLLPDLTLALGFYGAWTVAWLLLLRRFSFTARQIIVTQGAFGVLIEQNGAVLLSGLLTLPLGLILWLYVFLVYGSIAGIACRLAGLPAPTPRPSRWWQYPLACLAIFMSTFLCFALWNGGLHLVGLVPVPEPICTRPLW